MSRAPNSKRAVLMVSETSGAIGSVQNLILGVTRWIASEHGWQIYIGNIASQSLSQDSLYVRLANSYGAGFLQYRARSKVSLAIIRRMTHDIRTNQISIAHANGYKSNFHLLVACKVCGVPLISTLHTWTEHDWKDRFYSRIDQFILRYADVCIAVSEGMKQIAIAKGVPADKIVVVHNWVDGDRIQASAKAHAVSRNSLGLDETDLVLVVPARLSPEKGHEYLIEALERLVPKYPHLKALFAGAGFYHEHLAEFIRRRKLEEHIRLLGFRSDIHALMALADWIVLPSFKEGLPLSLLEAMALRKPIIATGVSGVPEIVQHGVNGFLVPPGDWQALATTIEEAIINRDIAAKYGNRGYEIVTTQFSPRSQIPKIVKVYEDVLKRRGIA